MTAVLKCCVPSRIINEKEGRDSQCSEARSEQAAGTASGGPSNLDPVLFATSATCSRLQPFEGFLCFPSVEDVQVDVDIRAYMFLSLLMPRHMIFGERGSDALKDAPFQDTIASLP